MDLSPGFPAACSNDIIVACGSLLAFLMDRDRWTLVETYRGWEIYKTDGGGYWAYDPSSTFDTSVYPALVEIKRIVMLIDTGKGGLQG